MFVTVSSDLHTSDIVIPFYSTRIMRLNVFCSIEKLGVCMAKALRPVPPTLMGDNDDGDDADVG